MQEVEAGVEIGNGEEGEIGGKDEERKGER